MLSPDWKDNIKNLTESKIEKNDEESSGKTQS